MRSGYLRIRDRKTGKESIIPYKAGDKRPEAQVLGFKYKKEDFKRQ